MSSIPRFNPTEKEIIKLGKYRETAEARRTQRIDGQGIHSIVKTISAFAGRKDAFFKRNPETDKHKKECRIYDRLETLKGNSIDIATQIRERLDYKMEHCGFWGIFTGKKVGYARLIKQLDAAINQLKAQELPRNPVRLHVFESEENYTTLLGSCGYDKTNGYVKALITHLSGKELLLKDKAPSTLEETAKINNLIEEFFNTFGASYSIDLKQRVLEARPVILANNANGINETCHSIIDNDLFISIMVRISVNIDYPPADQGKIGGSTPSAQSPAVETPAERFAIATEKAADKAIATVEKGLGAAYNWLRKITSPRKE